MSNPLKISLIETAREYSRYGRVGDKKNQLLCKQLFLCNIGFRLCFLLLHYFFVSGLWGFVNRVNETYRDGFESSLTYLFMLPLLLLWGMALIYNVHQLLGFYKICELLPHKINTAEFLLHLLLPRENRAAVIGDLAEEAEAIREKFGERKARLFWWCEVTKSVGPLLVSAAKKLLGLGVLDWIRRALSN